MQDARLSENRAALFVRGPLYWEYQKETAPDFSGAVSQISIGACSLSKTWKFP